MPYAERLRGFESGEPILSFVIAAHNSAAVIESTLDAAAKRLAQLSAEIIVVENGSTDDTLRILDLVCTTWPEHAPPLRVISAARGLGHAMRAGIACSTGQVVMVTADDLPFGFDDLDEAESIGFGLHEIVIGSKAHAGSKVDRSWRRTALSTGYRALRRAVLGMRTGDPQGTYIMNGEWARAMAPGLKEPGFLITTEITYAAELGGVHPVEVPVRLRDSAHRTRIRISDIYKMAVGLFVLRRRRSELGAAAAHAPRVSSPPPADRA